MDNNEKDKIKEFEDLINDGSIEYTTIEQFEKKDLYSFLYNYNIVKILTYKKIMEYNIIKDTTKNKNDKKIATEGSDFLFAIYDYMFDPDIEYTIYNKIKDVEKKFLGNWEFYLDITSAQLVSLKILTAYGKARDLNPQQLLAMYPPELVIEKFKQTDYYQKYGKELFDIAIEEVYKDQLSKEEQEMEEEGRGAR